MARIITYRLGGSFEVTEEEDVYIIEVGAQHPLLPAQVVLTTVIPKIRLPSVHRFLDEFLGLPSSREVVPAGLGPQPERFTY